MPHLRLLQGFCLLTTLILFSPFASAQKIRLFATASGAYLLNKNSFTINASSFQSSYANGGKFTFGGEYMRTKVIGLEGSYAVGNNNLRITDLSLTPSEYGFGTHIRRVNTNLVIHSPLGIKSIQPYITVGVGITQYIPTDGAKTLALSGSFANQSAPLKTSNKPGFNFGVGLEWTLFTTIAARFDVRNHTTGAPTYGLPPSSTTEAIFPVSGTANNLEISLGIVLHIGTSKF